MGPLAAYPARWIALLLAAVLLASGAASAQQTPDGARLFHYCTPCHGADGAGNPAVGAPSIAGLPQWYVAAQLRGFRSGLRGTHFDDREGMRMRPMTRTLDQVSTGTPFGANADALAAYVSSLPPTHPAPTLQGGDAAKGAQSYALCGSCHGMQGQGKQGQHAPPLAGASDWYLLTQLKKFKAGIRGWRQDDAFGQMMRGMAGTLADEQAMKDVIAHIQTLSK